MSHPQRGSSGSELRDAAMWVVLMWDTEQTQHLSMPALRKALGLPPARPTREEAQARLRIYVQSNGRTVTTPHDDPIVQACIDNGGHFWPDDAPEDEPSTCTRCWFNPGWKAGEPRNETNVRPIRDEPQA